MSFILSRVVAAWTLFENGVGNWRLSISSSTEWLLIVNVFNVGGLLVLWEREKVGSKRFEVDLLPDGVWPLVFGLHELSQMISIHVESDAWIELTLDPDAVD